MHKNYYYITDVMNHVIIEVCNNNYVVIE